MHGYVQEAEQVARVQCPFPAPLTEKVSRCFLVCETVVGLSVVTIDFFSCLSLLRFLGIKSNLLVVCSGYFLVFDELSSFIKEI